MVVLALSGGLITVALIGALVYGYDEAEHVNPDRPAGPAIRLWASDLAGPCVMS